MKDSLLKIISAAVAPLLLLSCEKDIEFIGQYEGEKLVLYSCATAGIELYANLALSRFILDPSGERLDAGVTGATVTAEAGGKTISLEPVEGYPGYYESDYIPSPGERITIRATHPKVGSVSSVTTVPAMPDIALDSYWIEPYAESDYYDIAHVKVTVKDRPGVHDCYRIALLKTTYMTDEKGEETVLGTDTMWPFSNDVIFMSDGADLEMFEGFLDGDEAFVPEYFDDAAIDGRTYTFEMKCEVTDQVPSWVLYYGADGKEIERTDECRYRFEYKLEVDAVSEDLYLYSKSLAAFNASEGIGSIFGEPVSIHNNIEGGIGCFGALSPSFHVFSFPN